MSEYYCQKKMNKLFLLKKILMNKIFNKKKTQVNLLFILFFVLIYFVYDRANNTMSQDSYNSSLYTYEPVDLVYTWVNGSDPILIGNMKRYDKNYDMSRFDDKNELKYSLRSIEKFASWIRNIYIVTNGQIPYWLNLDNKKIKIIQHEDIIDLPNVLPTFSSSAIETFIHRIPNLSKNFLYLNDDIFLGDYLYPDDLFTHANGVKVYTAWFVPDCANDCPWVFIGDGSCDVHCNFDECQYDGGDCLNDSENYNNPQETQTTSMLNNETDLKNVIKSQEQAPALSQLPQVPRFSINKTTLDQKHIKLFMKRTNRNLNVKFYDLIKYNLSSLNDNGGGGGGVQHETNTTNGINLFKSLVENYNYLHKKKLKTHKKPNHQYHELLRKNKVDEQKTKSASGNRDIYGQSLIYTNKLFNNVYGFKTRLVLGHVGFLLNLDILNGLFTKFNQEFYITKKNRFRSRNDVQFAFAYYHYLMSETKKVEIDEIFDKFDTDESGSLSDREIRTILSRIYPLPLDWSSVHYFEEIVTNCSNEILRYYGNIDENVKFPPTTIYERYEDSNIPKVTRNLVKMCPKLIKILQANFGKRPKYKFFVNPKINTDSNFKMLTSNVSQVIDALDDIRRAPKKFNCINDNLNYNYYDENQLIRLLLEDFYLSLFPMRSQYELNENYRNRFLYMNEYNEWRRTRQFIKYVIYGIFIILIATVLKLFIFKNKCNLKIDTRKIRFVK